MEVELQQRYRTRADAYRGFVEAQGLAISRSKFFADCLRLGLVQPDKSVLLADLVAYSRREAAVDPVGGASLGERERQRELAELELRKLRAEVETRERQLRKDDERWIEVSTHEERMAAFAGRLEEALGQQVAIALPRLVFVCGGDPGRASELAASLEEIVIEAFREAVRAEVVEVEFAAEDAA